MKARPADRSPARQNVDISAHNILLNKAVKLGKKQLEAQTGNNIPQCRQSSN